MKESSGLINPLRLRKLPRHYSWLDHRLTHEGYLAKVSPEACTLYLFLVCVSDQRGLSYYSDQAVKKRLSFSTIGDARKELIDADLIAFNSPFYQVLSLPEKKTAVENNTPREEPPPEFLAYWESLK